MPLNTNRFQLPDYLEKIATTKHYAKKDIICSPGDGCTDRCIIKSGMVKAFDLDSKGNPVTQLLYGPGDLFSPEHLISTISLELSFQAVEDAEIIHVPQQPFFKAARTDAAFSYEILQHIIIQMSFYKMRMDNLTFKHSRERLAFRLLLMAYRFGEIENKRITLPVTTQEELAQMINLTRESVSKGLKRLERLEYIQTSERHIAILDVEGLIKELPSHTKLPYFFKVVEEAAKSN